MADVQIAVIDQQNTQIAVIDQQNTQIVLSAPAETQVTIAVPGIQGPVGLTGDVELAQDGTASLPGIRFESDTNTGIYRAGTDQLAFATNGIGRVFISSAGNVGINNNSPATALDVSGTATASTFIGNLTGNVTGNLTGTASAIADNTVTSAKIVDGSIVDADINASAAIADTKLATISTAGKVSNSATTATSANTASAIVARDASNNFSAGTITANLTGNVTGNLTGIASNVTTNANLTGDVTSVGNATSIAAGVIVDADVNASAAIVGTKISPNFGSQTITTTGVISAAAGAAATPSIAFTGDTNTGIYSPGADQVAISTNGTGRLFINSSGSVGIGGIPTSAFSVTGGNVEISNATYNYYQVSATSGATGQFSANGNTSVELRAITNHPLAFYTNNTERLRITNAGLVGIGTSSPVYPLSVQGPGATPGRVYLGNTLEALASGANSGGAIYFGIDPTSATAPTAGIEASWGGVTTPQIHMGVMRDGNKGRISVLYDGSTRIYTATSERVRVDPTGTFNISCNSATAGFISSIGGSEVARIDSSGRLLMGTSSAFAIQGFSRSHYFAPIANEVNNQMVVAGVSTGTPALFFTRTRGGTPTTYTVVQDGDSLGLLEFYGADGISYGSSGARIQAFVDGTPGANDMPGRLVFSTTADGASSPTERMRIDNQGFVAIGRNSALARLHVGGETAQFPTSLRIEPTAHASSRRAAIGFGSDWLILQDTNGIGVLDFGLYNSASNRSFLTISTGGTTTLASNASTAPFVATINASEVARIDGSGRLLVGTSSALTEQFSGQARIQTAGTNYYAFSAFQYSNDIIENVISLCKSRNASVGSHTIVQNGDSLGSFRFQGSDGTGFITAANITGVVDGTPGTNDMPGRLVFSTTADGAASPTERMRITNAGNIGINTTSFGTSAAAVLALGNGTEPTTGPADSVQIYSVDSSAGNTTLGIRTEGNAVATETVTSNRTFLIRINGTTYKLLLATV